MDPELYAESNRVHDLIWSTKLDEAEAALEPLEKRHPLFSLMKAELFMTRALLSERKEDYQAASKCITEVRKKCSQLYHLRKPFLKSYLAKHGAAMESQAKEDGDSDEEDGPMDETADASEELKHASNALFSRAIGAEAAFMDCGIKFKLQKYVKGVLDFRKSWKTYEECQSIISKLQTNEEFPYLKEIDCLVAFGVGVFKFACSRVPRQFQWFVEGIGFKGDAIAALIDLERSSQQENMFRNRLSTMALSWIKAFFYFDYPGSHQLLEKQLSLFSESPTLHFLVGYILRKEGKIKESNESFFKALDLASSPEEFKLKIHYEIGYNYYILLDWQEAVNHLTPFFEHKVSEVFRAYCAFQLGFSHMMLKNKDKSVPYLKLVAQYVRKNFAFDEYGAKQAKKYLRKKQYTEFEVFFIKAMLAHEACNFDVAKEMIEKVAGKENGIQDLAREWYILGSCAAHTGDKEGAHEYYSKVLAQEKAIKDNKKEVFTLPWCYTGLSELAILEKEYEKAAQLLKKAKGFSAYDFETFLNVRIRKAEDDIRIATA